MANHEKVFGICENKCLVETITKSEFEFINEKIIQTPKKITEDAPYIVPESGSYTILAIGGAGGGGGGGGSGEGPYSGHTSKAGSAGKNRSGGAGGKTSLSTVGNGGNGGDGGFGFISYKSVNLEKGDQITVTLGQLGTAGKGGAAATSTGWNSNSDANGKNGATGSNGGNTVVFLNGTKILTANGGKGGAGGGGGFAMRGSLVPGSPGNGGAGGNGSYGGKGGVGADSTNYDEVTIESEDGLAGKTYTPNSSSEYVSSTDRNPKITWKTKLNLFGNTFTDLNKLASNTGVGQVFICINPINFFEIYPLK